MPNLPAQTVIAQGECSACGKPVRIKVNKTGKAYYFCPNVAPSGDLCHHHEKWGGALSQEMQRNYLAARKQSKEHPANESQSDTAPADDIQEQEEQASAGGSGDTDRDEWDTYAAFS